MNPLPSTFHNSEGQVGVQAGLINNTGVININTAHEEEAAPWDALGARRIKILSALHKAVEINRKDRNPDRVPGTCEWFTTHKAFKDWEASPSSKILWVSADPGSGKSVLAKYLVDYFLPGVDRVKPRTICYFFFKDDFEGQDSVITALRCILFQLFDTNRELLSKEIIERFEIAGEGSFNNLWAAFLLVTKAQDVGEIFCVLDALDECQDVERSLLISKLQQLYKSEVGSNLKFLITSRPIAKIRHGFHSSEISQSSLIHLSGETEAEVEKISHEIGIFIEARVNGIRERFSLTSDVTDIMLERLTGVPNRTYLWVYLTLNLVESSLGGKININKSVILEITSSLPATVDEAYERILSTSSDIESTRLLLKILVAAARPLRLREMSLMMQLALGDLRSYQGLDINLEKSESVEQRIGNYIRDLCGLFVVVVQSAVYFIHQTAKEFLVAGEVKGAVEPARRDLRWRNSLRVFDCQKVLFKACFRHLFFAEFESDPLRADEPVFEYTEKYVLLSYSSNYWITHLKNAQRKLQGEEVERALRLCDTTSNRCLTWFRVYWKSTGSEFPEGVTPLILASYCGLGDVVRTQLNSRLVYELGINVTDGKYERSALSWAAERGYDDIVTEILKVPRWRAIPSVFKREAKVNARDRYMRTPLTYAVWGGHISVIKALVKAGARADLRDDTEGTPLSYAICGGRSDIINILKKGGQGAISNDIAVVLFLSAVEQGRDDVVEYLLETAGVSPNETDRDGRAVLSTSAGKGHHKTCEVLIRHGAVVEARDGKGETAMMRSVLSGSSRTVRVFLENGASVEENFPSGETLFESAWDRKYHEVCWALIQAGGDVERESYGGLTPLALAVRGGAVELVEELLRRGANVEAKGQRGKTPLIEAARIGNTQTVQLLLDNRANINAVDGRGWTPLMTATRNGKIETVRLLLQRGADMELVESEDGWTALHFSVRFDYGPAKVVELLLESGASAEARDRHGQTPLALALGIKSDQVIISSLLKHGANTEAVDEHGRTPLIHATRWKNVAAVRLLLEHGAEARAVDAEGNTPLHYAVDGFYSPMGGPEEVVRLLLDSGASIEATDSKGRTPLFNAFDYESLLLLLDRGADIDATDNDGCTPLFWLSLLSWGDKYNQKIKALIDRGADIQTRLLRGNWRSLLYLAIGRGQLESVRALLDKGADIEEMKELGLTPLFYAVFKAGLFLSGFEIIKLLLNRGARQAVEDVCVKGQTVKLLDSFVNAVKDSNMRILGDTGCSNIEVQTSPNGPWAASRLDIFLADADTSTVWFED
ncbi:hypothetical protein TWF718_005765 [Orbilia javanica]|uniref:Nephrocystin 3-like N-terminal domain-containing protein n=1 Tax=Orbilia javanica TaxID=47235 RepID=A0AAN8N1H4_9PEZI